MIIRNMGCFDLVSIFFIYLFSLSNLLITIHYTSAQPTYVYHFCLGNNYTANSTFQTNLNQLLTSLYSASTSFIRYGYYETTVGENPDSVYGSLQCRGDITLEACQSCVKLASEDINISERCPNSKQAIVWYDSCMLRYSNQNYFNIMQENPGVYLVNVNNVTDPDQFYPILGDLMNDLVEKTTSGLSTKFASGSRSVTNQTELYGYVQCTEDISLTNCSRCLMGVISDIPLCCDGKRGGRVIRPSCNLRYEMYPFLRYVNTPSPPLLSFPAPRLSPPPLAALPPLILPPPLVSPPSSTNTTTANSNKENAYVLAISIAIPSVIALLSVIAFCFCCIRRKKTKTKKLDYFDDGIQNTESLQINFSTVSAATDNFSEANKLGEGGFGSVYKGTFSSSQEIAVKRLSKNSGQGEQEFKNEVTLVAKLQHRNLVKLVGFSLAGEEKLLIYEFMPNASLDQFLFDPIKRIQLDWERRYRIIGGVARGLVYLHEESRLKIIHRDLKASNILLDKDMNPKIADFGMARLFLLEQTQASTNRIVGTHGYMAPEYIMFGEFSVKSDVFSFGVLVLEILRGQRNSSFHRSDIARDLLSYAWKHWNNGSAIEILDPNLKDTCTRSEVMRCIHVGLLCVQENVADRPTMPTVVQMLNSYSATDPALPLAPAFFAGSTMRIEPNPTLGYSEEQGSSNNESISEAATRSVNEVTITELDPR